MLTELFSAFYFKQYLTMVTCPLNITARDEGTSGTDKLNIKQSFPSGRTIYYLSVTVFPYKSI
jgi:hypothetical protein